MLRWMGRNTWGHTKLTVKENLIKECEEEAGIPRSISFKAIPVGAISYLDIDGHRYKRDVEFCYDLKLPKSFLPKNEDGEVDSFKLTSVMQVAEVIHKTFFQAELLSHTSLLNILDIWISYETYE
ncbi:hypothetical protein JHK87_017883 [Glycine soja]|nr:hypothetical protein JHK87_017883 [Glycine soja]